MCASPKSSSADGTARRRDATPPADEVARSPDPASSADEPGRSPARPPAYRPATAGAVAPAGATGAAELVDRLLARCSFPPAGTPVDVAVSGGADSLALLVLAVGAGCEVTAHHVDHGLRSGSQGEAGLVAAGAERFGAGFVAHRVDVGPGPNLEARARAARYAVLPDGVLTGHTADDQAETVLLNLLRGAGLDGLGGMSPERRPLLRLRRSETVGLCRSLDLEPLRDPSNDDPAFRRNRVRHEVLPLLSDVAGRDVVPILARQADLLRDDAELLDTIGATNAETPTTPELPTTPEPAPETGAGFAPVSGAGSLEAPALAQLPPPVSRRILRRWLRDAGGPERHPPDAAAVERVLAVARGDAVGCDVGGGWRVTRSQNRLRLHPPTS